MTSFILLMLALLLVWGAWGLVKFIFSNFTAIFWTSIFFLCLFGAVLTSAVQ